MDTPYVEVDRSVLDANIAAMATQVLGRGLDLRPHAKTHKTAEVARRQIDAGATGLTVATVGEAERFAEAGFDDLFIAYPLWMTASKAARLIAVADTARVRLAVDSADGARAMAQALGDHRERFQILVEVDSGQHRTGCAPAAAGAVAAQARSSGLSVIGAFTFPGHGYSPDGRHTAAHDEAQALARAADAITAVGIEPRVRSGGSTPTVELADSQVLTEVRPGVYPFNDAQQVALGRVDESAIALWVVATVVHRDDEHVVVDAGSKTLGTESPSYVSGFGLVRDDPEAQVVALSEHHATVRTGASAPDLGSTVRIAPNHVCMTVNLVDELVVDDERWPVIARGANA